MSTTDNTPTPSEADETAPLSPEEAQRKAAERRAKIDAAYKDRAPKETSGGGKLVAAILVVLLVVGGVAAAVILGDRNAPDTSTAAGVPKGVTGEAGGIVVNGDMVAGKTVPVLDVYEDFQCPACKLAEDAFGKEIRQLAGQGKAKVVYHMKTFLDANLNNDSSMRATIGATCAADYGKFQEYHDTIFANQPPAEEEGKGYTDNQIQQFAVTAGLAGAELDGWKQCVASKKYSSYINRVEVQSAKDGVMGTPEYRIDGKKVDLSQGKTFTTLVEEATKK